MIPGADRLSSYHGPLGRRNRDDANRPTARPVRRNRQAIHGSYLAKIYPREFERRHDTPGLGIYFSRHLQVQNGKPLSASARSVAAHQRDPRGYFREFSFTDKRGGVAMSKGLLCDEDLVRRLPLPLAKLYRRAHNAKTPLDRHQAAYYLWEASLKLLGSVAVVAYVEHGQHRPELAASLQNLARPAIGHWWEFVRKLVPILADAGRDTGFCAVRDLVLGRARTDMPQTAALDTALREALGETAGSPGSVRLPALFDRMVHYRNREVGHGAAGRRPGTFTPAWVWRC